MDKNLLQGATLARLCQLHFLEKQDSKKLLLPSAKSGRNKICFDQLNSIFAKN